MDVAWTAEPGYRRSHHRRCRVVCVALQSLKWSVWPPEKELSIGVNFVQL